MQLKLFVVPIKNLSGAEAEMNGILRSLPKCGDSRAEWASLPPGENPEATLASTLPIR